MCNDECDLNCIERYKTKTTLFDKIVLSFLLIVMSICLAYMFIGLYNPKYFLCS
jgi:hypothetical protein